MADTLTEPGAVRWVHQKASLGPAEDLNYSLDLLRAVQHGDLKSPIVRAYRPQPTLAFGQRDARAPGFDAAQASARKAGFTPVVRKVGGRAAAYHPGSLVVDHLDFHPDPMTRFRERFSEFGQRFTAVLQSLGVQAAIGEITGEYCAGEFSVHGVIPETNTSPSQQIKLVGTAQRVVKTAWLFSAVLVIEDSTPVRDVLTTVYQDLELEWDPRTAGAAEDAVAGLTVDQVMDAVRQDYARRRPVEELDWRQLVRVVFPTLD